MRLRSLELIRYGSFADRTIDFGSGGADLHFVIGANEAGKSTMLSAIADLLFGIHERTTYAFRYPYGELRIGASVEHAGEILEVFRRKSRANSLLLRDETPLPDAALQPFLGGLDRASFERMFGLDHARLREGGRNMLEGKEDVSRILFEAGSGMSGIGEALKALEAEADEIFAQRAHSKPLNVSLKERESALSESRTRSVLPTRWKEITDARDQAERDHRDAIDRSAALELRRSLVDRDRRVRPILAKIDERLARLQAMGSLPALPEDAAAQRAALAGSMVVIETRLKERQDRLLEEDRKLQGLPNPSPVLDRKDEIERLEGDLPIHRRILRDLPLLEQKVTELEEARKRALSDVGLGEDVQLARKLDRQMARAAFDRIVEASREANRLNREVNMQQAELERHEEQLSSLSSPQGLAELRAALDRSPREALGTLREREAQRERARRQVRNGFAQLAPWPGEVGDLAGLAVPSSDTLGEFRRRSEDVERQRNEIAAQHADAEDAKIEAEAGLVRLSEQGGDPPTPEAVTEAREVRNGAIVELARAESDRVEKLAKTQGLVRAADALADRREIEAQRIAEYAGLKAEIGRRQNLLVALDRRAAALQRDMEVLESEWRALCSVIGFTAPLPISEMPGWLDKRDRLLEDLDSADEAERACAAFEEDLAAHAAVLKGVLRAFSVQLSDELGFDDLVRTASARLAELTEAQQSYAVAASKVRQLREESASVRRDAAAAADAEREASEKLTEALQAVGLGEVNSEALALALEALEVVALKEENAAAARRDVSSKKEEIARFRDDVGALAVDLGRPPPSDPAEFLTHVCAELTEAERVEDERAQLERSTVQLRGLVASDEQERNETKVQLDGLMQLAEAASTAELDTLIANVDLGRQLLAEVATLRDELVEAGDGLAEADLREEVESRTADEAAAELQTVEQEKRLAIEEVSTFASRLEQARAQERAASAGMDAAEALQAAEVARATAVDLAERHIRSKAAATLLRWAMNRYRETKEAPLLRRAGAILANVTGSSFEKLVLDWSRGEQPVIVAVRASGERCGVDDMSEGTRDQLFLALRLAAIEERAAVHAMPLICDDLLITADDARAARLISMLAELSGATQVICFTHHEHLLGVAERAIGTHRFTTHRVKPATDLRAA